MRPLRNLFFSVNHQSSIINSQYGFTLVEMLAVMIVFVFIGSIVVTILISTFRTSSKTDTLTIVRQNGNYALSQIAKTLRDARSLNTPYPCAAVSPTPVSTVTITSPDNTQVTYSCGNNTIASNGATLIDTTSVSAATCSFTCQQDSESDLPIILVSFSLKQLATSTFSDQKASISALPFATSIVLRNINR